MSRVEEPAAPLHLHALSSPGLTDVHRNVARYLGLREEAKLRGDAIQDEMPWFGPYCTHACRAGIPLGRSDTAGVRARLEHDSKVSFFDIVLHVYGRQAELLFRLADPVSIGERGLWLLQSVRCRMASHPSALHASFRAVWSVLASLDILAFADRCVGRFRDGLPAPLRPAFSSARGAIAMFGLRSLAKLGVAQGHLPATAPFSMGDRAACEAVGDGEAAAAQADAAEIDLAADESKDAFDADSSLLGLDAAPSVTEETGAGAAALDDSFYEPGEVDVEPGLPGIEEEAASPVAAARSPRLARNDVFGSPEKSTASAEDLMEVLDLSDAAPSPATPNRPMSPGIRTTPPPPSMTAVATSSHLSAAASLQQSSYVPAGSSRRQLREAVASVANFDQLFIYLADGAVSSLAKVGCPARQRGWTLLSERCVCVCGKGQCATYPGTAPPIQTPSCAAL